MYGRFDYYGVADIEREMALAEAMSKPGARDPKEGAGEFYRMKFQGGVDVIYFYRTGTLKNGNATGYRVDDYGGRKPKPPKKDSIHRPTLGVEWKKIGEKEVPPAVMARFKGVMESVELDEFRLLPRKKGDLRGAKKGQTITYEVSSYHGGGQKTLTVTGSTKAKGYGTILLAKDQKGKTYHLPLNSKGHATVVLMRTGDLNDPNESMAAHNAEPKAWISESLDEACGKKGKKKGRKEEIEAELERLEATNSPFPEVRARRIEELRAELAEGDTKAGDWKVGDSIKHRWGAIGVIEKIDKTKPPVYHVKVTKLGNMKLRDGDRLVRAGDKVAWDREDVHMRVSA